MSPDCVNENEIDFASDQATLDEITTELRRGMGAVGITQT